MYVPQVLKYFFQEVFYSTSKFSNILCMNFYRSNIAISNFSTIANQLK